MEPAQFFACPVCSFPEAKGATLCCRYVVSKYSDLNTIQANFTDAIPLCCDLNTLRTGLLNCLNARSRGLIQSEVRFL